MSSRRGRLPRAVSVVPPARSKLPSSIRLRIQSLALFLGVAVLTVGGSAGGQAAAPTSWGADGGQVSIKLDVPAGLAPLADDALPKLELDGIQGAKTTIRRGVSRRGSEFRVLGLCVEASSSMWAPDLEATIFDRLNDTIKQELERRGSVDKFEPSAPVSVPPRFESNLAAEVAMVEKGKARPLDGNAIPKVNVLAKSTLGFVGAEPSLVLCSVVCAEPVGDAPTCAPLLATTSFQGQFVPAPSPSLVGRVIGSFARAPFSSLGLVFGLSMMAVGAVVVAWPPRKGRAQPREEAAEDDEDA
jgi:hypothetical protein